MRHISVQVSRAKLFLAVILICSAMPAAGQTQPENRLSILESDFRINISTQFLLQRSSEKQSNITGFVENQHKLFYQNPMVSLNADWYGLSFVAFNTRLSYYNNSASHFEDHSFVQIGIPGLYRDNYNFRLLLLEPGIKVSIPFKRIEAFWSGNITFGFGTVKLNTEITPVDYENGETIPRYEYTNTYKDKKNNRGIGFSFSTGISYPVLSSLHVRAEIGYRNLNLGEFEIGSNFRVDTLTYKLNSFVPSVGITYLIQD